MIKTLSVYNPGELSTFVKDSKISIGGKPTDIIVEKITYCFGKAKVKLSNGETLIFICKNIKIVK